MLIKATYEFVLDNEDDFKKLQQVNEALANSISKKVETEVVDEVLPEIKSSLSDGTTITTNSSHVNTDVEATMNEADFANFKKELTWFVKQFGSESIVYECMIKRMETLKLKYVPTFKRTISKVTRKDHASMIISDLNELLLKTNKENDVGDLIEDDPVDDLIEDDLIEDDLIDDDLIDDEDESDEQVVDDESLKIAIKAYNEVHGKAKTKGVMADHKLKALADIPKLSEANKTALFKVVTSDI